MRFFILYCILFAHVRLLLFSCVMSCTHKQTGVNLQCGQFCPCRHFGHSAARFWASLEGKKSQGKWHAMLCRNYVPRDMSYYIWSVTMNIVVTLSFFSLLFYPLLAHSVREGVRGLWLPHRQCCRTWSKTKKEQLSTQVCETKKNLFFVLFWQVVRNFFCNTITVFLLRLLQYYLYLANCRHLCKNLIFICTLFCISFLERHCCRCHCVPSWQRQLCSLCRLQIWSSSPCTGGLLGAQRGAKRVTAVRSSK